MDMRMRRKIPQGLRLATFALLFVFQEAEIVVQPLYHLFPFFVARSEWHDIGLMESTEYERW